MLPNIVADEEWLYRSIPAAPNMWNTNGSITSAVFKQSTGVSVDRDGGRPVTEIVSALYARLHSSGVGRLQAATVRVSDAEVVADPTPDNDYHANIVKQDGTLTLSSRQARCLARAFELVDKSGS